MAGDSYNVSKAELPAANSTSRRQRADLVAGTIVWDGKNLSVVCSGGSLLRVQYVKVEGRRQVSGQEFGNGARVSDGERFGEV